MWIIHHASQDSLDALDAVFAEPKQGEDGIVWVRPLWLATMHAAALGQLQPSADVLVKYRP